jgi:transcriptional regulator with XRE-family HTH domain
VTDVERGARNPSLNSIKKLSDALGVSLSGLFSLVEGVERKDRLQAIFAYTLLSDSWTVGLDS